MVSVAIAVAVLIIIGIAVRLVAVLREQKKLAAMSPIQREFYMAEKEYRTAVAQAERNLSFERYRWRTSPRGSQQGCGVC